MRWAAGAGASPNGMPLLVVPVTYIARATPRAAIVRLGVPDDGEFSFAPGQAVSLGRHGQPVAKFYSIASAPGDLRRNGEIEFLVGTQEDGRFDAHLAALAPGTLVDLKGPLGSFGLPAEPHPPRFVFVAGGTGIAPLRAMWRHLVAFHPDAGLEVLYSARTRAHFAYRDELEQLQTAGRITLMLTTTREPPPPWAPAEARSPEPEVRRPGPIQSGRIGLGHLEGPVGRGPAVHLLCGPPAFVAHVDHLLTGLGVPQELIRKEDW
jgi:ferredoxin-NADP reductase